MDPLPPQSPPPPQDPSPEGEPRRKVLTASTAVMVGGLAAGYGTLAYMAARFLYPSQAAPRRWMFVAKVDDVDTGSTVAFRTPVGDTVTIARRLANGDADDFIALSSTCPHLGCKVHWEAQNNRFFCPCHNGVFTPEGKAIEGPPAEAGQSLPRYPLKVLNGLLYIEVTTETLTGGAGVGGAGVIDEPEGPPGPGHDPCLFPDFQRRAKPERHV